MTVDEALRTGQTGLLEAALRRVCYESTLHSDTGQRAARTLRDFQHDLRYATRPSALSGSFYESEAGQLASSVDQHLNLPSSAAHIAPPKIIIAPHAGHVYSGRTAGKVYALLAAHAAQIHRVVIFGPAHRVHFRGIACPGAGSFTTPLGSTALDTLGLDAIADLPFISTRPDAHAQEHCLEVHLPFIQRALPNASLLPLLVGDVSPEAVAQVMQRLWGDAETVFVISTDLSHFHSYDQSNAIDSASCAKILALDASLNHEQACGATPVNGALLQARQRGLHITQIERLNSGDTAGNSTEGRQRVVGYASFALYEPPSPSEDAIHSIAISADSIRPEGQFLIKSTALTDGQGQQLVQLARQFAARLKNSALLNR
jgi:MEMO1 family protein